MIAQNCSTGRAHTGVPTHTQHFAWHPAQEDKGSGWNSSTQQEGEGVKTTRAHRNQIHLRVQILQRARLFLANTQRVGREARNYVQRRRQLHAQEIASELRLSTMVHTARKKPSLY